MATRVPHPGEIVGYLVVFGENLVHRALIEDRARAELYAANCHGLCVPLIPAPTEREMNAEKPRHS